MTPQLGLAQEPRGELANPKAALRIPSRSQGFGLSHTYRKCCAHRCSRKLSTGSRLAARMPKNESKTDQRDTQTSTGCSDVRGRTRQSPAMQLSRPPVGWESSPSSAMFLQIEKAIMLPQPAADSPAAAALLMKVHPSHGTSSGLSLARQAHQPPPAWVSPSRKRCVRQPFWRDFLPRKGAQAGPGHGLAVLVLSVPWGTHPGAQDHIGGATSVRLRSSRHRQVRGSCAPARSTLAF